MKVNVVLPFDTIEPPQEFMSGDALVEVVRCVERAGFDGVCVTDHPAPTGRWLDAGGHHAQDPFVMLSLVAATSPTLRLQTGILVLPYRNPFIVARAASTLDVFSGGRVILGVGAGYLKGEYFAVGVDFEARNDLTDEYLKALKSAWTADEFSFHGSGYDARGIRILPRPLQSPHPPLWVGGNSRRAIRRAVELGDAWSPFHTSGATPVVSTARTAAMDGDSDLLQGIAYLKEHAAKVGRGKLPDIVLDSMKLPADPWNAQAALDEIARLEGLGVSWVTMHVPGRTRAEWCANAERFGSEVLAKLGSRARVDS